MNRIKDGVTRLWTLSLVKYLENWKDWPTEPVYDKKTQNWTYKVSTWQRWQILNRSVFGLSLVHTLTLTFGSFMWMWRPPHCKKGLKPKKFNYYWVKRFDFSSKYRPVQEDQTVKIRRYYLRILRSHGSEAEQTSSKASAPSCEQQSQFGSKYRLNLF